MCSCAKVVGGTVVSAIASGHRATCACANSCLGVVSSCLGLAFGLPLSEAIFVGHEGLEPSANGLREG